MLTYVMGRLNMTVDGRVRSYAVSPRHYAIVSMAVPLGEPMLIEDGDERVRIICADGCMMTVTQALVTGAMKLDQIERPQGLGTIIGHVGDMLCFDANGQLIMMQPN